MGQFISNHLEENLEFALTFFTLCWFLCTRRCSLELTADRIRDGMWCFTSRSLLSSPLHRMLALHFHAHSATTLLFLAGTKANCSSVFLALFHPSVFSLFSSVSFCPFHNNENHLFCLFFFLTLPLPAVYRMPIRAGASCAVIQLAPHKAGKESKMAFVLPYNGSSRVPI